MNPRLPCISVSSSMYLCLALNAFSLCKEDQTWNLLATPPWVLVVVRQCGEEAVS